MCRAFGDVVHGCVADGDGRVAIFDTDAVRERGVDVVGMPVDSSEYAAIACPDTGDAP